MGAVAVIVWITGQPGSGKTTLARALLDAGHVDHVVDGDDLRAMGLSVGFDRAGRRTNIDRARAIALYLSGQGWRVAVALVSPYADMREGLKRIAPVVEVYLTCSEPRGRESYFAADYEPPTDPDLSFDTRSTDVAEEVRAVSGAMAAPAPGARGDPGDGLPGRAGRAPARAGRAP